MTPSSFARGLATRLQRILPVGRGPSTAESDQPRDSEAGDTLIEVLISLVVLSFAALAMLVAFGAALSSSQEHRILTNIATAQKSVTQQIAAQLEDANPPLYQSCATAPTYQNPSPNAVNFSGLPTGYTAQITGVSYWGAAFTFTNNPAQCVANSPQLVSATLTYPSGGSSIVTTVVDNPTSPTPPSAGAATHMAFYTQPGNALSGANLSPQPIVEILDAGNHVVTTDLSHVVLTLNSTNGAVLSSSCTGSEFYGVVTFTGCSVLKDGTYTLTATDASLPNPTLTSNSFTVSVGPPSQLIFTQQPGGTITGGIAFPTQPQVTVEDAGGNVVTTDTSVVNLAITTGTPASGGPGTLSGCSQTETAGVISFSGCNINTAGTNYTLTATDVETGGTLTSPPSATFTVNVGPAAQLAFTTSPGASTGGIAFGTQPKVAVEDAGGNIVTNATNSITLAINSGTGTLACTTNPRNATNGTGVATFAGCKITLGTQGRIHPEREGHGPDHGDQQLVHGCRRCHSARLQDLTHGIERRRSVPDAACGVGRGLGGRSGDRCHELHHPRHQRRDGDAGVHRRQHPCGDQRRGHLRRLQDHAGHARTIHPEREGHGPDHGDQQLVHGRRHGDAVGLHSTAHELDWRHRIRDAATGLDRGLVG